VDDKTRLIISSRQFLSQLNVLSENVHSNVKAICWYMSFVYSKFILHSQKVTLLMWFNNKSEAGKNKKKKKSS